MLTSKIDKRLYKHLNLSNKLQCLLIEDKEAEKSAAALNVQVGAFQDPNNAQGLAHFCEHMLFMGTTSFPDESEYQHFISKHSGQTNAYTSSTNTNYFFSVANEQLENALNRFSEFFKHPIFKESCIQRERQAVHSEFNMNLQNDFWRKFQISKLLAPNNSSYSQFMIGNLETLGQVTRQDLMEFHSQYYSSNLMKLVIYGRQPLQQLEQYTQKLFNDISNKNYNRPEINIQKEDIKQNQLIRFVPIRDEDNLELVWTIDYLHNYYQNCPGKYIAHLIGHEGEGSLLSYLIKQDLAYELSCSTSDEAYKFSELSVRIKLTKKGLSNYQSVIDAIYNYINILEADQNIFNQLQQIKNLQFDFLEKQNPFEYVGTLAARMHLYPIQEVLKAPFLMQQFDSKLINSVIKQLRKDNVNVFLSSQTFKNQLGINEKYFGTEYSITPLNLQFSNQQIQNIHLPKLNQYIPTHTLLQENISNTKLPKLIYETPQTVLYYKQDDIFQVPKTIVKMRQYLGEMGKSVFQDVLGSLWQSLLDQHLRELFYEAEVASLYPSVNLVSNGIEYSLSGFSDSINNFNQDMLKKVLQFNIIEYKDSYLSQYERLKSELENFQMQPPYKQANLYCQMLLRDCGQFDPKDMLDALQKITFDDLIYFSKHLMDKSRFEWLITGNITENEALTIVQNSEKLFKFSSLLNKESVLQIRTLNLPSQPVFNYTKYLTIPTETNSSVVLYYQFETGTIKNQLIVDLLSCIIKTPFFAQLRTTEQLGYVVFSASSDIRGITGFQFLIQSSIKCPKYLQQRIREFLKSFDIKNMTQDQFNEYKNSIRVSLLEKDFSLAKETNRFWSEIQIHQYQFDRKQQALSILDNITLQEVKSYYEINFIMSPRQIEIHVVSPTHKVEQEQLNNTGITTENIDWIKRRLPLYPDLYSLL